MTDEEIIAALRRGVPVTRIVRNGLGINPPLRPTLHRVRALQSTWCPETRGKQGRPTMLRRRVSARRVWLKVPADWEWVKVSRETDSNGNVVSMKVEVSE